MSPTSAPTSALGSLNVEAGRSRSVQRSRSLARTVPSGSRTTTHAASAASPAFCVSAVRSIAALAVGLGVGGLGVGGLGVGAGGGLGLGLGFDDELLPHAA